jgi:hypothetical protein
MGSEARASADVLTPAQREQVRQAMVSQINATTRQVHTLTKAVERHDEWRKWLLDTMSQHGTLVYNVSTDTFHATRIDKLEEQVRCDGMSFWQRLRWLVTGR